MKKLFKTKKINPEHAGQYQSEKVNDQAQIKSVSDLYNAHFEKPGPSNSRILVVSLVIAVIFGLIAGMVSLFLFLSGAFANSPLFSWLDINSLLPTANVIIQKQEQTTVLEDERFLEVSSEISSVGVGIFKYRAGNATNITQNFYSESDFLGSGLIMTSDGWIVTTNDVSIQGESYAIITQQHQIFKVQDIKQDTNLGIVFLKIQAENLPVASMANFLDLQVGQENILLKGVKNFNKKTISTRVADKNFQITFKLIRDSEKRYLFFSLDKDFDKRYYGAPLFNFNKQVVGLLSNYNNENYLIPAEYFKKSFNQLITLGKIQDAYLGLQYINLATSITPNFDAHGALITAINYDSPLKETNAGINDIIIKVNDERVNGNYNLTNLIQNYRTGDKIKLTIVPQGKENGEEKIVEVELK